MERPRSLRRVWFAPIFASLALVASASVAGTASLGNVLRCAPQATARESSAAPLSPLARARRDCPGLGAILEEYAAIDLGEAFAHDVDVAPSAELVLAKRFATLGDVP